MIPQNFLSDGELLQRLLKDTDLELRGSSVKEMLNSPQSDSERLWLVREICVRYGENRIQRGDVFNRSQQVFDHFGIRLGNAHQEMFFTLVLDNKHRLISEVLISMGTLNQSLVHAREVFAPAIEQRAAAIILVHNHPSGDPQPSTQDINITKRLVEVGELVGIKVLDHIVIGQDKYFSFVDEDLM
jgi:DNA repair protein RadC